jgi:aspartyl-tRNA(Asn)/glutamyl-tRNA(Gln) amidotransferase subunit B
VEIKNLNSFKALEKSVAYEIQRQADLVRKGQAVRQETLGWNETNEVTFSQREKEEAHDYRYFPEPDLPPLVVGKEWIERIRAGLPELPQAKAQRFRSQYSLNPYDTNLLVEDQTVAAYFEGVCSAAPGLAPKTVANWILGDLFSLMNQAGITIGELRISPPGLAELLEMTAQGQINPATAKAVLGEMTSSGEPAGKIIARRGFGQISDSSQIATLVAQVLEQNSKEVASYLAGKETVAQWFFGQVMRRAQGQANPQVVRAELERQLEGLKAGQQD